MSLPARLVRTLVRAALSVVGGIALLLLAFFVLVWAESRVNLAQTVQHAHHLNDREADSGRIVTYTGGLSFERPADEPLLPRGDFARVERVAQTCAWSEVRVKNAAEPTYQKSWLDNVPDSDLFERTGYDNLAGVFGSRESNGAALRVGIFALAPVTDFLGAEIVVPSPEQVKGARTVDEEWAYLASDTRCGADGNAAIGDQRIRFRALRAGDLVTVFGRLDGERITAFRGQLILAKGGRDELLKRLAIDRDALTWMYRALGALLLWIALYLIIRPALDVVSWIPIFGDLARGAATAATLVLAALLTLGFVFRGWGMAFFAHLFQGMLG